MTDFHAETERLRREDKQTGPGGGAYRYREPRPPEPTETESAETESTETEPTQLQEPDGLSAAGRAVRQRQDRIARGFGAASIALGLGAVGFAAMQTGSLGAGCSVLGFLLLFWGAGRVLTGRDPR
ncbi:MAG: hypothetical protein AB8I08_31595 [Sandaracinaceae bacterium]